MNKTWKSCAALAAVLCCWLSAAAVRAQAVSPPAAPPAAAAMPAAAPAAVPPVAPPQPLYATVNGKPIMQGEFHAAYANHLRQKYYHGQVPQERLLEARKEVSDKLIDRILCLEEIQRRGITADPAELDRRVQDYDQRYANNPNWQRSRELMLPGLREKLAEQLAIGQLEQSVSKVPLPTGEEVRAFYAARPELFTEPEKFRLHSILLAVDPSSARPVWDAATREGEGIVRRIRAGADFSEQARLFSKDASAESGGDLGYLHRGMLPDSLQARLEEFKLGEVGGPIEMLQGVGVFRLDERVPPKLNDFDRVAARAHDLLHRDRQTQAWSDLVAKLRRDAVIVIHEPAPVAAQ